MSFNDKLIIQVIEILHKEMNKIAASTLKKTSKQSQDTCMINSILHSLQMHKIRRAQKC